MNWIQHHQFLAGLVSMAVLNCAVTAMPSPSPNGSKFYLWLFNFSHSLVGALARIFARNGTPPDGPAKV